ncbi:hypothetical protein [Pseudonocardia xishanensis]|uniref:Uncharacterized protein n=1 Tax=Pseudonocardia xishanensis TaxID=630995 RepID=A0ABP8RS86_9PSEU
MTTTTTYIPTEVPGLVLDDPGRWRAAGVDHWHLVADEHATGDPRRYSRDRWAAVREVGSADDPRDAWRWLVERRLAVLEAATDPGTVARRAGWGTPDAWAERCAVTWFMITTVPGSPAGGGISISDGRSLDLFAEPVTAGSCTRHS